MRYTITPHYNICIKTSNSKFTKWLFQFFFFSYLLHDSLLIVVAQRTAQLVVVHCRTILLYPPAARNLCYTQINKTTHVHKKFSVKTHKQTRGQDCNLVSSEETNCRTVQQNVYIYCFFPLCSLFLLLITVIRARPAGAAMCSLGACHTPSRGGSRCCCTCLTDHPLLGAAAAVQTRHPGEQPVAKKKKNKTAKN